MNTPTRRQFVKQASAALAAPIFIPACAQGKGNATAPSERVTIGVIGVGNQGRMHHEYLLAQPSFMVLAVCDPFKSRRLEAKASAEKAYGDRMPAGAYKGCADYNDFRELIGRDDIDAVFIASPEHWHGLHALAALRAGKDVYCEKALTNTIRQGRAVVDAAAKHRRVFQTGTQQRSASPWPHFLFACELVRNGYIGQLERIVVSVPHGDPSPVVQPEQVPEDLDYEMWQGPAPSRPYSSVRVNNIPGWMQCYEYGPGFLTGWGAHHLDIAQWGAGTDHTGPVEIEGTGVIPKQGIHNAVIEWEVHCRYASGVTMHFVDTKKAPMGVRFEGPEGWVFVDRDRFDAEPKSLLKVKFKDTDTRLYRSTHHHLNFLDCVKTRKQTICPAEIGHRSTSIGSLSDIAIRLGRKLRWNPETESFVDDAQANAMLSRKLRKPWKV